MTTELKSEIEKRTAEIAKFKDRLKVLQVAQDAPVADEFDDATQFMAAMREHHSSERDRLDELAAVEAVLPGAKSKLQELCDQFNGIKKPVETHLEQLKTAALEANKIMEQAETAYKQVLEMAVHQSELGHQTVFGTMPMHIVNASYAAVIFVVSANQISVMGRQQFRSYQRSGNVSEGVLT